MHFYTFYPSLFTLLVFVLFDFFFVVSFVQFSSFALLNAIDFRTTDFFFFKLCSSPIFDWKAHFEETYFCVKCTVMADKPNSACAFHIRVRILIVDFINFISSASEDTSFGQKMEKEQQNVNQPKHIFSVLAKKKKKQLVINSREIKTDSLVCARQCMYAKM